MDAVRMKHKLIRNNDVHPHTGFNKWLALLITTPGAGEERLAGSSQVAVWGG
jgi:hypothetical protein